VRCMELGKQQEILTMNIVVRVLTVLKRKSFAQICEITLSYFYRLLKQQTTYINSIEIKYILRKRRKSDKLIIILSACTAPKVKSRYNYMRTLKRCKENQLFIVDQYGYDGRGAYYLGKNCGNEIETACTQFIQKMIEKVRPKKVYFVGSSKGGWAAINLMMNFTGGGYVSIVGAPQYRLGTYLLNHGWPLTNQYMLPDPTLRNVDYLDDYLKNKLQRADSVPRTIYLHYSDSEFTYKEDIVFLLEDARQSGIKLITDCQHYDEHWKVAQEFPAFLMRSLREEGCSF